MDILSPYQSARAEDLQETDLEEDFSGGDWDPHTGTKALQTDGEASDVCSDEFWDPEDDPHQHFVGGLAGLVALEELAISGQSPPVCPRRVPDDPDGSAIYRQSRIWQLVPVGPECGNYFQTPPESR